YIATLFSLVLKMEASEEKELIRFLNENKMKMASDAADKLLAHRVTFQDLLNYREKEIDTKKQRESCKSMKVNILSSIDIRKILRNTPGSRCYNDANHEKIVISTVILNDDDQSQLEKMFEEAKKLSEKKKRLEEEKELIKEKGLRQKMELSKIADELLSKISQYKKKMLCGIDLLMKQKCKDLDNIVDQLKQKEVQMNEWHNKFNQVAANVNINTIERKKDISNLIQEIDHLLNNVDTTDPIQFDFSVDFPLDPILQFHNSLEFALPIASHDLQSDQISIHNERENKNQDNIQTELKVDAIHPQIQQKSIINTLKRTMVNFVNLYYINIAYLNITNNRRKTLSL
ncbi:hypothetical protein RFI_37213, partial [Reticulomyxa filosa]